MYAVLHRERDRLFPDEMFADRSRQGLVVTTLIQCMHGSCINRASVASGPDELAGRTPPPVGHR